MSRLVFDIETTGIPARCGFNKYFSYKQLRKYDRSRIVSIAWCVYSKKGILLKSNYDLVKAVDFVIDDSSVATKINGITSVRSKSEGVLFNEIAEKFRLDMDGVVHLIAHNILFDITILKSELFRYGYIDLVEKLEALPQYCTMLNSTNILKLPCASDKFYKSPKLLELYNYYFPGEEFSAHDALEDVRACARCYYKMRKGLDINSLPKRIGMLCDDWEEWESVEGARYYYNKLSKVTQYNNPKE